MTRRAPSPGKTGRRPVIPEQWNIPARAHDIMTTLGLLDENKQIDWEILDRAKTLADVKKAFQRAEDSPYLKKIWDFTEEGLLIWDWVREGKSPRFEPRAKMRHLAESIAAASMIGKGGREKISLRRSRDLCSERRRKGTIIRVEPYVECSCRYKGPAEDWKCPRCGAEISAVHHRLFLSFPKPH